MTAPWQLVLLWGLLVGVGVGAIAMVLGATIVSRWFVTNRGLVMGILAASTASGQLVFLPLLAWLASTIGWRAVDDHGGGGGGAAGAARPAPPAGAAASGRAARLTAPAGNEPDAGPAGNPITRAIAVLGRG